MKYVDEFRDGDKAAPSPARTVPEVRADRRYHLMEFCGGHTHAIFRYGIPDLLPDNVQLIHGPGCPVCVLPIGRLDMAIELARRPEVILCTYGDMLRVPGSGRETLMKVRAQGTDVRMLYSPADAITPGRSSIRTGRWCSSPSVLKPPPRPRHWCCARRNSWG